MAKTSRKKQDEKIELLVNEMLDIFSSARSEKKELALKLIRRIAFMQVTLEELETEIKIKGPTYRMENGSQKMIVENPAQKSYNNMINRYNTALKTLIDMLPQGDGEVDDGFDGFVSGRDG